MKNLLHLKGLYGYSQSLSSRSLRPRDEREAEQAHRRVSGGQSRSKCAARVRNANTELLKAEMTERRPREEKEPLSSTCLRSASVFTPFRLRYAACILMVLFMGIGNVWGQDTISVAEAGDNSGLIKIILAIIATVSGAGLAIHYTKNVKKNKSSNNQKTGGDFSPAVNNAQQGNDNTIDNSVNKGANINIHLLGTEEKAKVNNIPSDFEQDRKTIESLISLLDISVLEEFLYGNNQNRLDNRLFDIRDAWYSRYYPIEPIFNDAKTQKIMKDFYVEFNKLMQLCALYYDPMEGTTKYSKIRGLICDSFDDREDEKHFDEVIAQIKNIQPVYQAMKEFVIRNYKLDF